jgi:hypothetical protein
LIEQFYPDSPQQEDEPQNNNSDEQFTLGDKSPTYGSDGSYDEKEDFL